MLGHATRTNLLTPATSIRRFSPSAAFRFSHNAYRRIEARSVSFHVHSLHEWMHPEAQWSRSADSTVAERIRERSLLLDDLEEYTNSSERSRIRSATVESAERDQSLTGLVYIEYLIRVLTSNFLLNYLNFGIVFKEWYSKNTKLYNIHQDD